MFIARRSIKYQAKGKTQPKAPVAPVSVWFGNRHPTRQRKTCAYWQNIDRSYFTFRGVTDMPALPLPMPFAHAIAVAVDDCTTPSNYTGKNKNLTKPITTIFREIFSPGYYQYISFPVIITNVSLSMRLRLRSNETYITKFSCTLYNEGSFLKTSYDIQP